MDGIGMSYYTYSLDYLSLMASIAQEGGLHSPQSLLPPRSLCRISPPQSTHHRRLSRDLEARALARTEAVRPFLRGVHWPSRILEACG